MSAKHLEQAAAGLSKSLSRMDKAIQEMKAEMWCGCEVLIASASWCVWDHPEGVTECLKCGATWDTGTARQAYYDEMLSDDRRYENAV